jgi:hypothetical protein
MGADPRMVYGVHTSLKHLALAPPTPQIWRARGANAGLNGFIQDVCTP